MLKSKLIKLSRITCVLLTVLIVSCNPNKPSFIIETPSYPAETVIEGQIASLPSATPPITPATPNKLGIHMLLDDGRNNWDIEVWPLHLRYAREAVGGWGYITQLVRLDDLDVERWQLFMDICSELQLQPIIRLATVYDIEFGWWIAPPVDSDGSYQTVAEQYATFISALQWPSSEYYIIVGNEPNHGNEWGGRPDPSAYTQFLIDVASAIRGAAPESRILNAGLDPYTPHTGSYPFTDGMYYMDAESFMDLMVATNPDVFNYIDIWASHAYPLGPFSEGPWKQEYRVDLLNDASNPYHIDPPPGIFNRGVNGYEWELFKLSTYGVEDLPVMITETGWRHLETTNPLATDSYGALIDAVVMAEYLDLTLHGNHKHYPEYPEDGWTPWLKDPRVIAVTPFALNGYPAEWGHTNWLALDDSGQVLYTYAPFDLLVTGKIQQ